MAKEEVGIDLILRSPDIKGPMDEVINQWEELVDVEMAAAKSVDDYVATIATEMKNAKKANEEFKQSVQENVRIHEEEIAAIEKKEKVKKRSIFAAIADYFKERAELKAVTNEIQQVENELARLETKQRAIGYAARKGNQDAIKEYNALEKKIIELNKKLAELDAKQGSAAAKVELSSKKFAGLGKILSVVKTGALLAATAIVAVGAATLGAIVAIGKNNDQVKNQFDKVSKAAARFKDALSTAFAPVAFTIGKLFESLATKIGDFIINNQEAIFKWSVNVAGNIAGTLAFVKNEVLKFTNFVRIITKDVQLIGSEISEALARSNPRGGNLANAEKKQQEELRKTRRELIDTNEELGESEDAFNKAKERTIAQFEKYNLAFFKTKNLTQEQIDAIKRMRAEYDKLREAINKQINDLDVQEAGPIVGMLLKAELAANAIEKERDRYLELARALGKSQTEVVDLTKKFERLINTTRQSAQRDVLRELNETLTKLESQVAENAAERTGQEANLKLDRTLKAFQLQRDALDEMTGKLQEYAKEHKINIDLINEIIKKTFDAIDILEVDALEQLTASEDDKRIQKIIDGKKKQAEDLKKAQDEIIKTLKRDDFKGEDFDTLIIDFEENEKKLAQLQADVEFFKKIASDNVKIDVQIDNAETRKELEDTVTEVFGPDVQVAVDLVNKGVEIAAAPNFLDIETAFQDVNAAIDKTFGDDFIDRTASAFQFMRDIAVSAIDDQIEAINRLVEARNNSVDELRAQVQFEAELKSLGIANDFDLLKKQLDQEIELRNNAAAKQFELQSKRDKIQRQQDSLNQASSLATAIANVFKGTAGNPVATLAAIALSALLLVTFANAKIQAAKLAKAYKGSRRVGETFGELAPGEGERDDAYSNRGLKVYDKKGNLRGVMGGDEFLHKESVSKRHRKAFNYLNENESKFAHVDLMDYLKAAEKSGHVQSPIINLPEINHEHFVNYERITQKNNKHRERLIVISRGLSEDKVEKAVATAVKKATDELAVKMINYLESRPTYIDGDIKNLVTVNAKNKNTKKIL